MMDLLWNSSGSFTGKSANGVHDLIIHGLDKQIEHAGKMITYPVGPFQDSIDSWNGIPAVYVPNGVHIPPEELNADSLAALRKYNGKMVGRFDNSKVITDGMKRLQSQATITDPEIEDAINAGKIALSSTFYGKVADGKVGGPIVPSYVLLFDQSKESPKDQFSTFLNSNSTEDKTMAEDAVKINNLERDVEELNKEVVLMNSQAADKEAVINTLKQEKEELTALMNSQAESKDATIKALEEELVEFKNSQAEAKWGSLKASHIPKGMVATPELETELRALYNSNADEFYMKLLEVKRPDETNRDGVTVHNNSNADNEALSAINELKESTGRFY